MPRLAAHVYAAHQANVLKLAAQEGGVSRTQIAEALNITRAVADSIIKRAGLLPAGKKGRTQFFKSPNGTSPKPATDAPEPEAPKTLPPEVKAAVVAPSPEVTEVDLDEVAQLDEEIIDTRNALRAEAAKAGKALGEWATHQALVDALRDRMTELAKRRMNACS
jgi:hypothetical protein